MNRLLFLFLLSLTSIACVKELDLKSGNCFDVKKFMDSKNAYRVKCGTTADFEGTKICLKGLIDITEDPATGLPVHIGLLGGKNYDVAINIIVDEAILEEVYKELKRKKGRITNIHAEIMGFDRLGQLSCTRGFEMLVKHTDEITFN